MKDAKEITNRVTGEDDLELFEYLLEEEEIVLPESDRIQRSESTGTAPLSFAQQRLWFLEQMQPGSPVYNLPGALRLIGRLSVPVLERSLNEIIRRHEALRTTFASVNEQPIQVIKPSLSLTIPITDLSQLPEFEREAETKRIASEEASRPFDLTEGPLIRTQLLRLSAAEQILLVSLHHLIADGWSIGLLVRELAALYAAYSQGQPSPLPEPPLQYPDYARWQRAQAEHGLAAQMAYWREKLRGPLPVVSLAADKVRPAVASGRGASVRGAVSGEVSQGLKQVGRQAGASLFMVLVSGVGVWLGRLSGQGEVMVGTAVAGRVRQELEGVMGMMVNTLMIRQEVRGGERFEELLERVKEEMLGGYGNQEVGYEKVVEEVRRGGGVSQSPLFQVMFTLQDDWMPTIELDGLTIIPFDIPAPVSKFDIAFEMREVNGGLIAVLDYNTDIYEEETAQRLLDHYLQVLESIAANPAEKVARLNLLTPAQRQRLLSQWNRTARPFPQRSISDLIGEQARQRPDRIALVSEGEAVSYGQLWRRARGVARELRRRGVKAEQGVGMGCERGVEMVVGMLGVLEAGGAYVPIDGNYPRARMEYLMRDSGVQVVLVDEGRGEAWEGKGVEVLRMGRAWQRRMGESEAAGEEIGGEELAGGELGGGELAGGELGGGELAGAEQVAYIIYTSGSTGLPKGVQVQHSGLTNLVGWHHHTYDITAQDRASWIAGVAFDASVWEIWPYLTAGASIHIPNEETRAHPQKLAEWIAREGLTICFAPTPVAEMILDEPSLRDSRLRYLLTGGDKLSRFARQDHGFALINHYGPTENTVVATCAHVPATTDEHAAPPIGRPIANTQAYILDEELEPVAVGVTGELYIGGAGLARGYLNRPELTAAAFIPNPFSSEPGTRLYKTSDLARYLADGNIEFIGRSDAQVKIRGYRIEPSEIEAVLDACATVSKSLVLAREDRTRGRQLIAYVVPRSSPSLSASELRQFMKERLPEYMLPSAFVILEAWPLTVNGKIDRARLPEPDALTQSCREDFLEPATRMERVIAAIWRDVLKVGRVGRHDNFFDLGGHSLLLVQVHSRLQEELGLPVSIIDLLKIPTVSSLAAHLSRQAGQPLSRRDSRDRGQTRRQSIGERARQSQDRHRTKKA
jgi:amino acid adenylation domain-containing protein